MECKFSLFIIVESADVDLDKLLGELCELESQLNADNPESFFKILSTGDAKSVNRSILLTNNNISSPMRNGQTTTDLDREFHQHHRNSTPNKQLTVDTCHTDPLKVNSCCAIPNKMNVREVITVLDNGLPSYAKS